MPLKLMSSGHSFQYDEVSPSMTHDPGILRIVNHAAPHGTHVR
jgi:hypothetical protein